MRLGCRALRRQLDAGFNIQRATLSIPDLLGGGENRERTTRDRRPRRGTPDTPPRFAGRGLLIQLRRGANPLWLDLSARWNRDGRGTIVSDGGITESSEGGTVPPVRSLMSLWQFRIGIAGTF